MPVIADVSVKCNVDCKNESIISKVQNINKKLNPDTVFWSYASSFLNLIKFPEGLAKFLMSKIHFNHRLNLNVDDADDGIKDRFVSLLKPKCAGLPIKKKAFYGLFCIKRSYAYFLCAQKKVCSFYLYFFTCINVLNNQ